jgi:hypothetical protein
MENSAENSTFFNPEQAAVIRRRIKELVEKAKNYDTVIFLDKAARPLVSAFTQEWKNSNKDLELPHRKFLNLGTEKLRVMYHWGLDNLPPLKAGEKYVIEEMITRENIADIFGAENIETVNKILGDAQNVLIVDDLSHSGRSIRIAKSILSAVRPEMTIDAFLLLDDDKDKKPFLNKNNLPFLPWRSFTGVQDPTQEEKDPFSQFGNENKRSFSAAALSADKQEIRLKAQKLREKLRKLMNGTT